MEFLEPMLLCLSSKSRTILVYIAIYTLVVYMALTLIWNEFASYNSIQQVLFSAGASSSVGVMMLIFFPFIDKKLKEPYLLLFVYAVLITLVFLFFYYNIFKGLFWFPTFYMIALCQTIIPYYKQKKK